MATNEFEVGSIDSLPEFRVVMNDGGLFPMPMMEIRKTKLQAFLSIERSENINEETLKVFAECIMLAGASAAVAGFVPGGLVVLPTFLQTFGVHATSRGLNLAASQLRLRTETIYGEWERFA